MNRSNKCSNCQQLTDTSTITTTSTTTTTTTTLITPTIIIITTSHTIFFRCRSAPFFSKTLTIMWNPCEQATIRGVLPS